MPSTALTLPLWVDLAAVAIAAIQGAMFAARMKERKIDLLGVALIGVLVGLGGGLVRDLLLNQLPAALASNWYLLTTSLAALAGMALLRVVAKLGPLIIALDAVALGLFAATGTAKALEFGLPTVPAIFVGVITAVGGGILRDVTLNVPVAVMHVGSLYAIAATAGSALLVGLVALGVEVLVAATACMLVTTMIRLGSVRFGWSLPEQRALRTWKVWQPGAAAATGAIRVVRPGTHPRAPADTAPNGDPAPDANTPTDQGTSR